MLCDYLDTRGKPKTKSRLSAIVLLCQLWRSRMASINMTLNILVGVALIVGGPIVCNKPSLWQRQLVSI